MTIVRLSKIFDERSGDRDHTYADVAERLVLGMNRDLNLIDRVATWDLFPGIHLPRYTTLDCARFIRLFGIGIPDTELTLRQVLR